MAVVTWLISVVVPDRLDEPVNGVGHPGRLLPAAHLLRDTSGRRTARSGAHMKNSGQHGREW